MPGSHATIQEAIDDPACTTISLAAQTYPESISILRSLTLSGPPAGGAIVEGLVWVVGSGSVVDLADLLVQNGCPESLLVQGGAQVNGANLQVIHSAALPCPPPPLIFTDGFESGDTSGWSGQVPPP